MHMNISLALLNNTNVTLVDDGKSQGNQSKLASAMHPDMVLTEAFKLFFTVALLAIGVIGLFGNSFVLISFAFVRKLKTSVNMFLVSLSLAEFIICVSVLPLELQWHVKGSFIHSLFVCELMYTLHFALLSCSAISLMAVSVFRFYTIAYPFLAKRIKRKLVLTLIGLIWIYSTFSGLLPVFGWRPKGSEVAKGKCLYKAELEYLLFIVVANYIFPGIIMTIFYAKIFCIAHRHAVKIAKNHICSAEEQKNRRKQKILLKGAITLAKIVGTFMLCWAPYIIDLILFYSRIQPPRMVHLSFYVLAYSNIAVNPFLYAGLCEDFRSVFWRCVRETRHFLLHKKIPIIARGTSTSFFQSNKTPSFTATQT